MADRVTFERKVPEWQAEGNEPPAERKASGFTAGYKPPAGYFNWFWNGMYRAVSEIQQKLGAYIEANETEKSSHFNSSGNPHKVTALQTGAYTKEQVDSLLLNKANLMDIEGALFVDDTERQVGWYLTGTDGSGDRLYKPWYEAKEIKQVPATGTTVFTYSVVQNAETIRLRGACWISGENNAPLPYAADAFVSQLNIHNISTAGFNIWQGRGNNHSCELFFNYTKTTDTAKTKAEIMSGV